MQAKGNPAHLLANCTACYANNNGEVLSSFLNVGPWGLLRLLRRGWRRVCLGRSPTRALTLALVTMRHERAPPDCSQMLTLLIGSMNSGAKEPSRRRHRCGCSFPPWRSAPDQQSRRGSSGRHSVFWNGLHQLRRAQMRPPAPPFAANCLAEARRAAPELQEALGPRTAATRAGVGGEDATTDDPAKNPGLLKMVEVKLRADRRQHAEAPVAGS